MVYKYSHKKTGESDGNVGEKVSSGGDGCSSAGAWDSASLGRLRSRVAGYVNRHVESNYES